MKTLLFSLFATLLFVCTGNAQKSESAILTIKTGKNFQEYKFKSFAELDSKADALIADAAKQYGGTTLDNGNSACQQEISIHLTLSCGPSTITVTITVQNNCFVIAQTIREVRAQLYAAAMSACGN